MVAVLVLPVWIICDYSFDLIARQSCGISIADLICGYHQPEREAILRSLTVFHVVTVIGNIATGWLVYHGRMSLALFASIVPLGFFADFFFEYQLAVVDALCNDEVHFCGGPTTLLSVFLERYDKFFLSFFPLQLLWNIRLIVEPRFKEGIS